MKEPIHSVNRRSLFRVPLIAAAGSLNYWGLPPQMPPIERLASRPRER
jgi:hypothetical protein